MLAERLRTALWIERTLADEVLPRLLAQAAVPQLVHALERHLLETREHVRVVRALAGEDDGLESTALLGLLAEHERLPRGDLAVCLTAAAIEQLEAGLYGALVALADEEAAAVLRELEEQEAFALEEVERARTLLLAETVYARP